MGPIPEREEKEHRLTLPEEPLTMTVLGDESALPFVFVARSMLADKHMIVGQNGGVF